MAAAAQAMPAAAQPRAAEAMYDSAQGSSSGAGAEDDGSLALARMLAGQEQSPLGFDVTHSTLRRFSTLEEVRHWPRAELPVNDEPETEEEATMRLVLELTAAEEKDFEDRLLALAGVRQAPDPAHAGAGASEEEVEEEDVPLDEMTYAQIGELQDAIGYVSRGATAEAVSALPNRAYAKRREAEGEDDLCAICQCSFCEGELTSVFPCGHFFHAQCAALALAVNKACPLCKEDATGGSCSAKRGRKST